MSDRVIKFKALDEDTMIFSDKTYDDGYIWTFEDGKMQCLRIFTVSPGHEPPYTDSEPLEPLMQYTGLKDKNGVEVYDGDIVKDNHGRLMQVVWCEDQPDFTRKHFARWEFKWIPTDDREENNFEYAEVNSWFNYKTDCLDVAIIGNIHENPELLK